MYNFLIKHKVSLVYLPLAFYWLLLLALTTLPSQSMPGITLSDKISHFLGYFGLAFLLNLTLLVQDKFRSLKKYPSFFTLLFGTVYGLADELHQMLVPGRSCDMLDWLADIIGTIIGILVIKILVKLVFPPKAA